VAPVVFAGTFVTCAFSCDLPPDTAAACSDSDFSVVAFCVVPALLSAVVEDGDGVAVAASSRLVVSPATPALLPTLSLICLALCTTWINSCDNNVQREAGKLPEAYKLSSVFQQSVLNVVLGCPKQRPRRRKYRLSARILRMPCERRTAHIPIASSQCLVHDAGHTQHTYRTLPPRRRSQLKQLPSLQPVPSWRRERMAEEVHDS